MEKKIKELLSKAFIAGMQREKSMDYGFTDCNFRCWYETVKDQVKNIAVLDGVSVNPDQLRSMAKEITQKFGKKHFKGVESIRALTDRSALERVAKLLEERS